jgi:DNA-binding Xre family transcriptional regulator
MIKFYIKEVLKVKGYKPNTHILQRMGLRYTAANRLIKGETRSLTLDHLEMLCVFLNCTPNDILNFEMNAENPLNSEHPLNTLIKPINQESPIDYIKTLTPEQAVEATALVKAFWEKQKKQK